MNKKNDRLKNFKRNLGVIIFLFIVSVSLIYLGLYLSKYGQGFYGKNHEWVDTATARADGLLIMSFGFFSLLITILIALFGKQIDK